MEKWFHILMLGFSFLLQMYIDIVFQHIDQPVVALRLILIFIIS